MNITKSNFSEELERIIHDINDSTFISIDAEFTGLFGTASGQVTLFDTPEKMYSFIKERCSDFLLIQFGLCAFNADEEKRIYKAKPYNFFTFPTPFSKHAPDKTFKSQSSSIDFLCSHGFDFNILYREGISYLTPEQEKNLRCEMEHISDKSKRGKSKKKQQQKIKEKQSLQKMEIEKQVGFSYVIKALTSSKKLIVGHNMILDIFHVINNFHGALPADLEDFKTVTKSVFPNLLDTKLMATTQPLKELILSSALDKLFTQLQNPPFSPVHVEVAQGFERYQNEAGALHEAGFDALVTGRCFVTMLKYLGSLQSPPAVFPLPSSSMVEQFINKIYLMRTKNATHINLDSPHLVNKVADVVNKMADVVNKMADVDNKDHVFYVTVREEWESKDVQALFQPYGNIQILWLSQTAAMVELYEKERATLALKELSQQVGSFHVELYADHQSRTSSGSASTSVAVTAQRFNSKHKLETVDGDSVPCKVISRSSTNEASTSTISEEFKNLSDSIKEDENSDCSNHSE